MVDLARREGAINVLVVLAGSNDLTLGADPIALAGAMNAYVARRTGFITAVLPLLPRDFPGFESKRLAFNASLSGLVVNLDALNDPAYYVDGIHPNEAGFSIIAERVAETLLPLLRSSS